MKFLIKIPKFKFVATFQFILTLIQKYKMSNVKSGKVGKWETSPLKKSLWRQKIIAKKLAQFRNYLYLCNKVARMTSSSENCGITIEQIFLSARESVP